MVTKIVNQYKSESHYKNKICSTIPVYNYIFPLLNSSWVVFLKV